MALHGLSLAATATAAQAVPGLPLPARFGLLLVVGAAGMLLGDLTVGRLLEAQAGALGVRAAAAAGGAVPAAGAEPAAGGGRCRRWALPGPGSRRRCRCRSSCRRRRRTRSAARCRGWSRRGGSAGGARVRRSRVRRRTRWVIALPTAVTAASRRAVRREAGAVRAGGA
ncbi:hypothetical protein KCH_15500 [Kitasatospora cheerisanensis KCTC 2395]|uniref:Uncharacterized protein n=1 Tax=Kitasatospora cheerisanensis KCTC 2395 TaxID=1348663 RepID=A0A066YZQ4_9ACTN|nr:hypothetical protein KCH_15500 [Kitasatospora cheerisanensis KCTC 2395]